MILNFLLLWRIKILQETVPEPLISHVLYLCWSQSPNSLLLPWAERFTYPHHAQQNKASAQPTKGGEGWLLCSCSVRGHILKFI